ncbi:MAG TPA: Ig-like domain-containing protein [Steroidobacteraceae bacterium]
MARQLPGPRCVLLTAAIGMASALLCSCAGNGVGLDANGNPIGSGSSAPVALSANFQSIQDNVFTPICTRCHIGANAPEGLQLDQAHSYALLVGVPSAELPGTLRVKAGDPTDSYLIQKLQGSSGIVGVQMPFGGPYLPQSTIDLIKQWITNGAPQATAAAATPSIAHEQAQPVALAVTATMPADGSFVTAPLATIAIGFGHEPDASFLNGAVRVQNITAQPIQVPVLIAQAEGNPATVLLTPLAPLAAGTYRVTVHGGDATAMTAVGGESLPADYSFTFTVEMP